LFAAFTIVFWLQTRTRRGKPASTSLPRLEILYAAFFLVSPVVNPWYALWMLPFIAARPSAWGVASLAAVTLSYAHGSWLSDPGLPPYHHPGWVRPVEIAAIVLIHVAWSTHERNSRRLPAKGHGDGDSDDKAIGGVASVERLGEE